MKVLLDACVIFPTVMREMLVGLAQAGLYTPLWSERILEEWVGATKRLGDGADVIARTEAAVMRDAFPKSMVVGHEEDAVWLPDENDMHVLGAAIHGGADILLTKNLSDFPTRILSKHGVLRRDPDGFMCDFLTDNYDTVLKAAQSVQKKAEDISGRDQNLRGLLKRSGLPRLGKALTIPPGV